MEITMLIEKQCGDILIKILNFINLSKLLISAESKHNITIMNK